MRAAPPIQVAVECRRAAASVAALAGAAAAGCAAWLFGHAQWPGAAVGAFAAGSAGFLVCWSRICPVRGDLAWDGRAWHWQQEAGDVRVMIDTGGWMVVTFVPVVGGRCRWLCVAAGHSRAAWHGLRAAVYCRASTPTRR